MTIIATNVAQSRNPALLNNATTYAQAGVRVLPLKQGQKVPAIHDWPNKATTDQAQIKKWFSGSSVFNLGLAMGEWAQTATNGTWLVCIDLDRHEPEHDGVALFDQLVATHGTMGEPFIADTATGGMHLVYQTNVQLTNERGQLPRGIDVRGTGGQIMAEPSVHPQNGQTPKWRISAKWATHSPGLIPGWLLQIIQAQPEQITQPHLRVVGDDTTATSSAQSRTLSSARPGDIYNDTHTWDSVLASYGWQCVEQSSGTHGRKSFYARPGKPAIKDQHSAVLAHDTGAHGVLTVFSTNAPTELLQAKFTTATGGHYKFASPFDFYTAMQHGGDHKQAAKHVGAQVRQLEPTTKPAPLATVHTNGHNPGEPLPTDQANMQTPEPIGNSYSLRPLSELIGVPHEPRTPNRLLMTTGNGLMYDNADNLVASASGTMKSWLSALTCLQQIQQGRQVVVIDYEMQMRDWFTRFTALGATHTELALVHYCAPDEPLRHAAFGDEFAQPAAQVLSEQVARIAELPGGLAWVVIDGVTNAMTQNNLKLLDNTDIAKFYEILPKLIIRLTGAGVGLNDHVPKNAQGDAVLPIGGQHKVATTSGAAHVLRADRFMSRAPLTPGVVVFKCVKDRHGEIGQGREVAQAIFTPHQNGTVSAVVEPYTGEHTDRVSTKELKILQTLREIAATGHPCTLNKIANVGALDKANLSGHLKQMAAHGKIRNYGTDKNHDWRETPHDNGVALATDDSTLGF
jgi:hypothetical protein